MAKYAIIENELSVRRGLKDQIQRLRPEWVTAFEAETVEDAVGFLLRKPQPDIIFMDIELDDGNCFEIFRKVEVDVPVVFTTAYSEYALRAFKVNSLHYLLKPIMEDDVLAAIRKFERHILVKYNYAETVESIDRSRASVSRILITIGDTFRSIDISRIAWLAAEEKYIYVYTTDGQRVLTDFRSLREAQPIFEHSDFFQISRSVMTSMAAVTKITRYFKGRLQVHLNAGEYNTTAVVSSERRDALLAWYGWYPATK